MLKKIIVLCLILLLVVGAVLVYLLFNVDSLVSGFKPQIESLAGQSIGGHVKLGKLSVSLVPSVRINVSDFTLSKTKASKENLKFKNLVLYARLLPLLSGRLEIIKFAIDNPDLQLIKDQGGIHLNGWPPAQSIKTKAQKKKIPAAENLSAKASATQSNLKLSIDSFSVNNASLILKDLEKDKEFAVSQISLEGRISFGSEKLELSGLNLNGRVTGGSKISATCSRLKVLQAENQLDIKNLQLNISDSPLLIDATYNYKNKEGSADLTVKSFQLAGLTPVLESFSPDLKKYPVSGLLDGNLEINSGQTGPRLSGNLTFDGLAAVMSGLTLKDISGKIEISHESPTSGWPPHRLELAANTCNLNGHDLKAGLNLLFPAINRVEGIFTFQAFSGTGSIQPKLVFSGDRDFRFDVDISSLDLTPLLKAFKPAAGEKISGRLEKFNGAFSGKAGAQLKQSLSGNSSLVLKNASFKDINLAADVLKSLSTLPFIEGKLLSSLTAEQKKALADSDTKIKALSAEIAVRQSTVMTDNLKINSDLFDLDGKGKLSFDAILDIRADIFFSPALSQALTAKVKELRNVLNKENRLVIPLSITGTLQKPIVMPDLEKLIKAAATKQIENQARDLLGDLLGSGKKNNQKSKKSGLGGLLSGF